MLDENSIYLSEAAIESIKNAVEPLQAAIQAKTGNVYSTADIEQAARNWLELCLESLSEEMLFHLVEGYDNHAFNRQAFGQLVSRLKPQAEVLNLVTPEPVKTAA